MYKAGKLKTTPAAAASPVEVMVCTMLFSRMVPRLNRPLRTAIETTAAGMDALTVMPTLSPR